MKSSKITGFWRSRAGQPGRRFYLDCVHAVHRRAQGLDSRSVLWCQVPVTSALEPLWLESRGLCVLVKNLFKVLSVMGRKRGLRNVALQAEEFGSRAFAFVPRLVFMWTDASPCVITKMLPHGPLEIYLLEANRKHPPIATKSPKIFPMRP